MNTPTRLAAFAAGLAVVFAAATGVGRAVGPAADSLGPTTGDHRSNNGAPIDRLAPTAVPKGLQISERGYSLQLPVPTLPDGPWKLSVTVLGPDGQALTRYEKIHGSEMHLVVVQRDLSGYRHLHPRRNPAGVWSSPVDLSAGTYRVFADFQPPGSVGELTLGADLIVLGSAHPGLLPEPSRTAYVDDYDVDLTGGLAPATVSKLTFTVRRGGKPVADLQQYDGALGHLVVLRSGDLAYLDVHQDGSSPRFDVAVPSPGTYRLYFDFQHRNVARTAEFTAVATAGAPSPGRTGEHGG